MTPMPPRLSPAAPLLSERVRALEQAFEQIARTRMAGLPLLHPGLAVRAVGFRPETPWQPAPGGEDDACGPQPDIALGVLVTPWFMNLIRLPLGPQAAARLPAPGAHTPLRLGGQQLDFIGAEDAQIGRYALCSLFSPMQDFIDQAGAVATAESVLTLLRQGAQPPAGAAAGVADRVDAPSSPPLIPPSMPASIAPVNAPRHAPLNVPVGAPVGAPATAAPPARRGFLFGRRPAAGT